MFKVAHLQLHKLCYEENALIVRGEFTPPTTGRLIWNKCVILAICYRVPPAPSEYEKLRKVMLPVLCSLISSVRPAAYHLLRAEYIYILIFSRVVSQTHDVTTQDFYAVPEGSWTLADEHLTIPWHTFLQACHLQRDLGCACILPEAIPVLTLDVMDPVLDRMKSNLSFSEVLGEANLVPR
jgi:hypothetical protein